jgi:cystathionine beta-lyase
MNFDTPIERRGTYSTKWDMMEPIYGVPTDDGVSMWVADTDFQAPPNVLARMQEITDHGIFAYTCNDQDYRKAIKWWMETRHNWQIETDWIFTTTGLVNAVALTLDTFTQPGDGIVLFTPVYHAFARAIRNANREVVECPLVNNNGRYEMDFDAYDAQMTGSERMVILCSPHNPGGRVWTQEELRGVADFCRRHDLLLVSDEIHHDLVFPGHTHIPMANVDADIQERLIMLTAPSKTFNVAGLHTGNVIIPNRALWDRFAARMTSLAISPNSVGQFVAQACYSPEGAEWVDAQVAYLDGNRQLFDAAIQDIPGLKSMALESTFLAWVDFTDTGMERAEFTKRVERDARIAANHGTTFGLGGENFLRFNLGTQRANIEKACNRLRDAFADLQ